MLKISRRVSPIIGHKNDFGPATAGFGAQNYDDGMKPDVDDHIPASLPANPGTQKTFKFAA